MILLSALLASLTGFVSGERPIERAHVELSAVATVVQAGAAVTQSSIRPENQRPRLVRRAVDSVRLEQQTPVRSARMLLNLKQSWLN